MLARIEGEPEGTKGVSLFLVPKTRVNTDGTLGEPNDVAVTGIEDKMGLHGSATCQVTFGGKGQCLGTLLGPKNKGMRGMFLMMNEERMNVGMQSLSMASASYLYAVNYARERVQGKHLLRFLEEGAPAVPIIEHPDVKRMLMWMKVYVDGMRSLNYFVGRCFDLHTVAPTQEERDYNLGLVELLVPVLKAYCSDRSFEVCVQGMQVFGGYGYCKDYPMEQLVRDSKITSIYEGSNGIQAMDLLARQLGKQKGQVFMNLLSEVGKTIALAKEISHLEAMAGQVEVAAGKLAELAMFMGQNAMSDKIIVAFTNASPFLEVMGDVMLGWMHLWRGVIAVQALEKIVGDSDPEKKAAILAKNKDAAYYDGMMKGSDYFINSILPITLGKMNGILANSQAIALMDERAFGGM